MYLHILTTQLILIFVASVGTFAQSDSPIFEGQPETARAALARHHIQLTESALLKALRSPKPEVRDLAAEVLAQDGTTNAIPLIKAAMLAETVPGKRINFAFALAQLGDPIGRETLKNICDNNKEPAYIRMSAAVNMRYLKDESCMDAVFSVLQSNPDDDGGAGKAQALSLLPSFKHLAAEDPQRTVDVVTKALSDATPGVRMVASSTLGTLGQISAIPHLRAALEKEQNESCRLQMSLDLQRLQNKKNTQTSPSRE